MSMTMPMRAGIFPGVVPRPSATTVPIAIYGNRWCGITQRIRRTLDRAGIAYQYVDLDLYPDAERKLRTVAGPSLSTPVVYVDGDWLMAPTMRQLEYTLEHHGVW